MRPRDEQAAQGFRWRQMRNATHPSKARRLGGDGRERCLFRLCLIHSCCSGDVLLIASYCRHLRPGDSLALK